MTQDKNKYNTPKYRFVVRFTNKDIVCQVGKIIMSFTFFNLKQCRDALTSIVRKGGCVFNELFSRLSHAIGSLPPFQTGQNIRDMKVIDFGGWWYS